MIDALRRLIVALAGRDDSTDEGLGTLELVVIALGLFLAATGLVAVITKAIDGYASQIS